MIMNKISELLDKQNVLNKLKSNKYIYNSNVYNNIIMNAINVHKNRKITITI